MRTYSESPQTSNPILLPLVLLFKIMDQKMEKNIQNGGQLAAVHIFLEDDDYPEAQVIFPF